MNNRFVKNNIGLLAVTTICSLVALVVLVFVIIEGVEMSKNSAKVKAMRDEIQKIIKQNPAPVEGNKPLLEQDIAVYRRAASELQAHFGHPLEPALDEFFKTLKVRKDREMWKEEFGDEPVPDQLTRQRFVELFRKKWDGIEATNYAKQRYEFNEFRRSFLNWPEAQAAFVKTAQPCVVEPLNSDNADEVLMAALGFQRRMDGDPRKLKTVFDNTREQLLKDLNDQIQIAPSAIGLGFGIGGGENLAPGSTETLNFNVEDYPLIVRHLDIISDMVRRLRTSGIKCVYDIRIRRGGDGGNAEGGDAGGSGARFNETFENSNGYDISHYQIEVSGSMAGIRKLTALLDRAYPDRRVYIVRTVFLYAEENGADRIFSGVDKEEEAGGNLAPAAPAPVQPVQRRRRRRGPEVAEDTASQVDTEGDRQRKLEDARRRYRERQARLPYEKRDGYGEVLVGTGETFRAVIDIDYVAQSSR